MAEAGARRPFFRRRKSCPFTGANAPKIDYKDSKLLMRYVSERGKIVPSRITAVSAKKWRRRRLAGWLRRQGPSPRASAATRRGSSPSLPPSSLRPSSSLRLPPSFLPPPTNQPNT